uniref:hypothetical chloroplast RF20 n=1 Tax=Polulichloris maxima TaxID=2704661 RepID=UPI002410FD62|nr:hypothetical chloroplast RF20 [Polulichloris maxima]WDY13273.1 hypothetical chloroplast RF20 [Polulichloris maxima]
MQIKKKTRYLQQNILSMLCILLIGFLGGNLFGTTLNVLREWMVWDGFIIAILIVVIEIISYFVYRPIRYKIKSYTQSKRNWSVCFAKQILDRGFVSKKQALATGNEVDYFAKRKLSNHFNLFKIGAMIGFFVDAFKVGS